MSGSSQSHARIDPLTVMEDDEIVEIGVIVSVVLRVSEPLDGLYFMCAQSSTYRGAFGGGAQGVLYSHPPLAKLDHLEDFASS